MKKTLTAIALVIASAAIAADGHDAMRNSTGNSELDSLINNGSLPYANLIGLYSGSNGSSSRTTIVPGSTAAAAFQSRVPKGSAFYNALRTNMRASNSGNSQPVTVYRNSDGSPYAARIGNSTYNFDSGKRTSGPGLGNGNKGNKNNKKK